MARGERDPNAAGRARTLRRVRRPVRSGGADPGPGRAGRRVDGPAGRSGVPRGARRLAPRLRRAAVGDDVRTPSVGGDRLPHLSQAGGPEPHRRPQDQQHAGAGAARAPAGQRSDHRGDRRRDARCRHRDGVRVVRPPVRRLHGRGGHGTAGAERRPDAAARGGGRHGHLRKPNAEGRPQRGPPRLGCDGDRHALRARLGRGAAPVPRAGSRPPARDRRRGPNPDPGARGTDPDVVVACVGGGSNAIGIFEAFVADPEVGLVGVEAGGRGDGLGEHCRSLTFGAPGVLTGPSPTCCRTSRVRSSRRIRSRRVWTTRASGPNTPSSRTRGARPTSRSPTRRRSRASACSRRSRASCPPSNRLTRSAGCCAVRSRRGRSSS